MTLEAQARQSIDQRLAQAGWPVQDHKALNLGAGLGVVVRQFPTATGPADYVLFVERQPVGVIEAKRNETILTFVEDQTERFAWSALKWQVNSQPLPFLYESTGRVTRFTDGRDPAPRLPQDPNDEPASLLLECIRAERAARIVSTRSRQSSVEHGAKSSQKSRRGRMAGRPRIAEEPA